MIAVLLLVFSVFSVSVSAKENSWVEKNPVTKYQLQEIVKQIKDQWDSRLVFLEQDVKILKETYDLCKKNEGKLNINRDNIETVWSWFFEETGNLARLKDIKDMNLKKLDDSAKKPSKEMLEYLNGALEVARKNKEWRWDKLNEDTERLNTIIKELEDLKSREAQNVT